jgi:hypothetical protein
MGIELRTHLPGNAGHLVEIPGAADIDPVPQLLHPHLALRRRDTDGTELFGNLRTRQSDQRRPCRRHVDFERDLFQGRVGAGTGFD